MARMAAEPATSGETLRRRVSLPFGIPGAVLLLGFLALAVVALLSMKLGAVELTWDEVFNGLTSNSDPLARNIVWQIRFPRLIDGMLVGAALAVSGALLQGVTRNPLADPTILGVTAAAG